MGGAALGAFGGTGALASSKFGTWMMGASQKALAGSVFTGTQGAAKVLSNIGNFAIKTAAKPLKDDMKDLAPVYKGKIKKGSKRTYYNVPYKPGTLKKSIASWHTKRGLFVAPRIGVLHPKVLGKPNLDGWYAHLALAPHKIRGGKKTSDHQSKHFIEKARLRKKDQVLRLIGSMVRRLIEKNYRR